MDIKENFCGAGQNFFNISLKVLKWPLVNETLDIMSIGIILL